MAAPFKRVCLCVSRQRVCQMRAPSPRQAVRAISTTPQQRRAEEIQPASDTSTELSDPMLNELINQPGVKYTITEESEDLSKLGADNMSSLAHRELEQHKELREMVRIAAWEMPLLSQFAKPFEPPTEEQVLRWRYTTYMGEPHPAARKVVVEFQPERLRELRPEQREKLLKLVGVRYNPSTKTVKMSCESFETQAQNKRYLADTIGKLIAEAKDLESDSFADVPLDTRHHKPRIRYEFPQAWIMTPERRAELEAKRKAALLEEGRKVEQNKLIDGEVIIQDLIKQDEKQAEESVMATLRPQLPKGKAGKQRAQR